MPIPIFNELAVSCIKQYFKYTHIKNKNALWSAKSKIDSTENVTLNVLASYIYPK